MYYSEFSREYGSLHKYYKYIITKTPLIDHHKSNTAEVIEGDDSKWWGGGSKGGTSRTAHHYNLIKLFSIS